MPRTKRTAFADTEKTNTRPAAVPSLADDPWRLVTDLLEASGVRVDSVAVSGLAAAQAETLSKQKDLISRFDGREISPAEFQQLAQEEHRHTLQRFKAILGEKFYAVFGPAGDSPECVSDPIPFFFGT